jgi:hypothetical protein
MSVIRLVFVGFIKLEELLGVWVQFRLHVVKEVKIVTANSFQRRKLFLSVEVDIAV